MGNMDDITKPLSDAKDKARQKVDEVSDGLTEATDKVSKYAEDGITKVEEKLDSFINTFDNFLKKF